MLSQHDDDKGRGVSSSPHLTHGSLFSGIGGFDLASKWMGWENVFHCESDLFCQKVLNHHFPNSKLHTDVRQFDGTIYRGRVSVLSGGFPCQPFSLGGKRKGTEDSRNLWKEMFRIVQEIQPKFVVGENVRGLLNWSEGMVFEQVCSDLESAKYEVLPIVLPACGVNAPHRRQRIFFIAHSISSGEGRTSRGDEEESRREGIPEWNEVEHSILSDNLRRLSPELTKSRDTTWSEFPTQSSLCGGDDGIPRELDSISFPKWRRESIMTYGNAVVPQLAYKIFKSIQETYEQYP